MQVSLYDDVMVDPAYKNYLLEQVRKRKYSTVLYKLTDEDINWWKPKQPESWELIDPYSDIEVIYSSGYDSSGDVPGDPVTNDNNECLSSDQSESDQLKNLDNPNYNLCDRSYRRCNPRLQRSTQRAINYNVDHVNKDIPRSPKKPKPVQHATPYGPSEGGIAARKKHTLPPEVTHLIPRKKPLKIETDESDNEPPVEPGAESNTVASPVKSPHEKSDAPGDTSDSDDNLPLANLLGKSTFPGKPAKKKRVLVTRKVGIRKYKRKRSF